MLPTKQDASARPDDQAVADSRGLSGGLSGGLQGCPSTGPLNVLLISTYELGRQPFGLASPAAWLRNAGSEVFCRDLAVQPLDMGEVGRADLVAFYLPMHTATRIAAQVIDKVKAANPHAHLCAYGLYAPVNEEFLREKGVDTILGGEFEEGLVNLCHRIENSASAGGTGTEIHSGSSTDSKVQQTEPVISLGKQKFVTPHRSNLPPLSKYAHLHSSDGDLRTVGYTEASRGCKHLCRHCPIVPVYGGKFRIVQKEVVLEDIRQQVGMGAGHITFGDPDFFNGPKHAIDIVSALHREHPDLSYDVTIKIEHLLKYPNHLETLRDTGCAFVITAVESIDDEILARLGKGHTRADFVEVVEFSKRVGLVLSPTFLTFTPWTTLAGYKALLTTIAELGLIDHVSPIQFAIRLLIPAGSRLLDLSEVKTLVKPFDKSGLVFPWEHSDPRVDALQNEVAELVGANANVGDRNEIFAEIWDRLHRFTNEITPAIPATPVLEARCTIPFLNEPWYC
jgi:radical SAM superfamily enzyme YgiQ (UPF0313 family)